MTASRASGWTAERRAGVGDFNGRGATRTRAFRHQHLEVCLPEHGATKAKANLIAASRVELTRSTLTGVNA